MSPTAPLNPEAEPKKPSVTEAVDSLIAKKKAEKQVEGETEVLEQAEGIKTEVADVMEGVETLKPSEKVSEKKEKKGEGVAAKAGGPPADEDAAGVAAIPDFKLPSEEVMVKKVRSAIQAQIKMEWKKAKKLRGKLTSGGAQEYNSVIARIRALKEVLAGLFSATFTYVKSLYLKYFTPDGKRRPMEEIQ